MAEMDPQQKWTPAHCRIVDQFREWMDARGHSPAQACGLLAIKRSTLSTMLNKKYVGDVAGICEAMARVLRRARLRDLAPTRPPFVLTSTAEQVLDACTTAHIEHIIALVMGPSGIGKTLALKRYCDVVEPDSVYVVAGISASPWAALKLIAQEMGVPFNINARQLRANLAAKLRDSGKLVVIDEVDYVPEATFQALRMLAEEAGIGMVWSGTAALYDKIRGKGSATGRQVVRRIRFAPPIGRCSTDDLRQILSYYALPEDVLRAVIAGAGGEADRAVSAVVGARRFVGAAGKVTVDTVRRAYETLPPQEIEND